MDTFKKGGLLGTRRNALAQPTRKTFYATIHDFIERELGLAYAHASPPGDEKRYLVYKQAFNLFIEEFKTYKDILSDIKNEYEKRMEKLQEQCQFLRPLQTQVNIMRLETAAEVSNATQKTHELLEKFRYGFFQCRDALAKRT
jgi:hypothetical protein